MMHVDVMGQVQPLSRLEWKVVALAIREAGDAPCPGRGPIGRIGAWLSRLLTGTEPARPLGDPRLDALRRFVCVSRRGVAPKPALTDELMGFGYTPAQLAALGQLSR